MLLKFTDLQIYTLINVCVCLGLGRRGGGFCEAHTAIHSWSPFLAVLYKANGGVCTNAWLPVAQACTLKVSSSSECTLLRERRSGSFRSSLVKVATALMWFFMMRFLRARIRVSCRASTEFTSSMPERSA